MSKGSNSSTSRPSFSISMTPEVAFNIAKAAHQGQVDKQGVDYIQHPIFLADMFDNQDAKVICYLHDVLEDTDITVNQLKEEGITTLQLQAVLALTRNPQEVTYHQFIDSICTLKGKLGIVVRQVKIADIQHHLLRANNLQFESMVKKRYLPAIQKLRQAQQDKQEKFVPTIIEQEQLNV